LVITCADNDQFVMLSLRHGSAHAALGADDDVANLVTRLRRAWPDVALHFRGDCGFGVPALYEVCEGLSVSYTFGLSANAVLQRETQGLLAEAVAAYERERQAARPRLARRPREQKKRPQVVYLGRLNHLFRMLYWAPVFVTGMALASFYRIPL
jgi:hypothetical protein